MSASRKIFLSFKIAIAIFLFSAQQTFAQVVINELLPNPVNNEDWVELYNTTDQEINLNGWVLDDEAQSHMVEIKEATISAKGFFVFEVGSRLNQSDDTIYLIDASELMVDEYYYNENPGSGISFGRIPDGGDWGVCQIPTRGVFNSCVLPTPTATPTLTPTPTPVPTVTMVPTPTSRPSATSTPTPRPTSTVTPTLSPTPEVTGTEEEIATPTASLLGEAQSTTAGEVLAQSTVPDRKLSAYLFLGGGLLFLFLGSLWLWYTHLAKRGKTSE